MPKEEWGVKRLCPKCDTRFYDLQADPMTCPNCGSSFDLASLLSGSSKIASAPAAEKEDDLIDLDDDVDTDDLLDDGDDDDLLDDDDDDSVSLDDIADMPGDDEDN